MKIGTVASGDQSSEGIQLWIVTDIKNANTDLAEVEITSEDYGPEHPDFAWAVDQLALLEG